MGFHVAIPSYQRSELLQQKTLSFLERQNVPADYVTIFVADEAEAQVYRSALIGKRYSHVVVGRPTLRGARRAIIEHYPQDAPVLCLDDDVSDLMRLCGTRLVPEADLMATAEDAFALCKRSRARLWGVGPVPNHFFMRETVSNGPSFIVGCFYGMLVDKDERRHTTLAFKEDYERSLQWFAMDGVTIRFNYLAVKTKFYASIGGLASARTVQAQQEAVVALAARFPGRVRLNKRRTSPYPEILIKTRR